MRILLAQLTPLPADLRANAERVARAIEDHPEARLALLPELFLSGYSPANAHALACTPDDPRLGPISDAARATKTAVVVGFVERVAEGGVANSVACFEADGRLVACYRKAHLFGESERRAFLPGATLRIVRLARVRVAPLICFDVEFPEPARALASAGAELLVTVSANMAAYRDEHELAVRARALENRPPHAYVNRSGRESGHEFVGDSKLVDADGRVVSRAGRLQEIHVADLHLGAARRDRDLDYLRQLRPDLGVEEPFS